MIAFTLGVAVVGSWATTGAAPQRPNNGPQRLADEPQSIAVAASGSIPGISQQDLDPYVVGAMNASHVGGWHFEGAGAAGAQPSYRVEWTFSQNTYAAGTVRTYGFSRAMMQRLLGSRSFITIEARLFLGGQYQTLVLGHATVTEGARSTELADEIAKLSRQLMAYPVLDTTPPGRKPGPPS